MCCFDIIGYAKIGGDPMEKRKKTENEEVIIVDPFGAYTGCPQDMSEYPVQDADDL